MYRRFVGGQSIFILVLASASAVREARADSDELRHFGTSNGVEFHFALNRPYKGCTYGTIKNTSSDKMKVDWGYEGTSESGATRTLGRTPDSGWILKPGQSVGGWAAILWCPFNKPVGDAPATEKLTLLRIINIKVHNMSEEERQKEAARQQEEQQRLAEQQRQEQQRQEQQRQEQQRQEQQRREEERRQREEAERERQQQQQQLQQQQQQEQQQQHDDDPQQVQTNGGRGSGTAPASGSQRAGGTETPRQLPRGDKGLGTAVTAGLAAGAGLAILGGMSKVEDRVTPFEINVGAQFGVVRGGMTIGGTLELHLLLWRDRQPNAGETLAQTLGQLRGHEVYAVGHVGAIFDSWLDCNTAPCTSYTEAGRVLYGELGYRYWHKWLGIGGVFRTVSESTTAETARLDGEMPDDHANATFGAELMAALHRGSRQRSLYGGVRVFPFDPGVGALLRLGMNRMGISLGVATASIGFTVDIGMGLRFGL